MLVWILDFRSNLLSREVVDLAEVDFRLDLGQALFQLFSPLLQWFVETTEAAAVQLILLVQLVGVGDLLLSLL